MQITIQLLYIYTRIKEEDRKLKCSIKEKSSEKNLLIIVIVINIIGQNIAIILFSLLLTPKIKIRKNFASARVEREI